MPDSPTMSRRDLVLTRRALLLAGALAAAGCRPDHRAAPPDPDAAALASARDAEAGIVAAYDALVAAAGPGAGSGVAALLEARDAHVAHLAALGGRRATSSAAPVRSNAAAVAAARAAVAASVPALQQAAVHARRGPTASLLASIAAAHAADGVTATRSSRGPRS